MWKRRLAIAALCLPVLGFAAYYVVVEFILVDPFRATFAAECGSCHGDALEGTALGPPLVGVPATRGITPGAVERVVREGIEGAPGMPAFADTLDPLTIRQLALYVTEQRETLEFFDYRIDAPLTVPSATVQTDEHAFELETLVTDIDPLPFSMALLADGEFLVTEKVRGLYRVKTDGTRVKIRDAPRAWNEGFEMPIVKVEHGHGWMLEVATHPRYPDNDWIYLH